MQSSNLSEMNDLPRGGISSPYILWLIWVIWLPFIIPPLASLQQSHTSLLHLIMTLAEVSVFLSLYLVATWQAAQRLAGGTMPIGRAEITIWLILLVLVVLSSALALTGSASQWLAPFIFTSGYAGGSMRTRRSIIAVLTLTLLLIILCLLIRLDWPYTLQGGVFVAATGFIAMSVVWSIKTNRELRIAKEEIARLAVTTERLRIARDLHDLLGHNLSLIALKSELAGRLVQMGRERAAVEISDIEQLARTTLQEVREAVASYRQPTLANELQGAQEILSAAGITYDYKHDETHMEPLPTVVETALAWAVREGVTNIIRHSHARKCTISLQRHKGMASVEIINDGVDEADQAQRHASSHGTGRGGNGVRGLSERVEALGGQLTAQPYNDKCFRLAISIPLTKRTGAAGTNTSAQPISANVPLSANGKQVERNGTQ